MHQNVSTRGPKNKDKKKKCPPVDLAIVCDTPTIRSRKQNRQTRSFVARVELGKEETGGRGREFKCWVVKCLCLGRDRNATGAGLSCGQSPAVLFLSETTNSIRALRLPAGALLSCSRSPWIVRRNTIAETVRRNTIAEIVHRNTINETVRRNTIAETSHRNTVPRNTIAEAVHRNTIAEAVPRNTIAEIVHRNTVHRNTIVETARRNTIAETVHRNTVHRNTIVETVRRNTIAETVLRNTVAFLPVPCDVAKKVLERCASD